MSDDPKKTTPDGEMPGRNEAEPSKEGQAEMNAAEKPADASHESDVKPVQAAGGEGGKADSPEAEKPKDASGIVEAADAKPVDPEREAKIKAAAEARAARAAAKAAQEGAEGGAASGTADADKEAKIKAAAEARAARAAAKAAQEAAEPPIPKEPSPNQPRLDRAAALIREQVAADAVDEAYINEPDGHRPYLVIKPEHWIRTAQLLKENGEFGLNYLRNVSGTDMETHLEVVYHLVSLDTRHEYGIKIKTDREKPSVDSVTPVWATANWNEREIYDLFGIDFPGHPDLRRIMMPDDWIGHPLRKDYEPFDPEV